MKVLVRADASTRIGTGHVIRCLTIAKVLRDVDAEVLFVSRNDPGNLIEFTRQQGFNVAVIEHTKIVDELSDAMFTKKIAESFFPDWIIIDNYHIDVEWETILKKVTPKVLAIDDIGRNHNCTVLLNQSLLPETDDSECKDKSKYNYRRLLGPKYALLGAEYALLRKTLCPRSGIIGRLLIFFGGSDVSNETLKVVDALQTAELESLDVDVVVGVNHPNPNGIYERLKDHPKAKIHRGLPTLAELMVHADLAIGAGGTTSWERAALGLPALVAIVAENQKAQSLALQSAGAHKVLGSVEHKPGSGEWHAAICALLNAPEQVREMSVNAMRLTDGLGAKRVVRTLLANKNVGACLRAAKSDDERLLLQWANDPVVRQNSFAKKLISPAEHADWFRTKLADPMTSIFIGEEILGLPFGQIRFDFNSEQHEATISISIDNTLRGLGLAQEMLSKALELQIIRKRTKWLVAETLKANTYSARLFLNCGFVESSPRRIGSRCFVYQVRQYLN